MKNLKQLFFIAALLLGLVGVSFAHSEGGLGGGISKEKKWIQFRELSDASVPTPQSGWINTFASTDGEIKQKDDTSTVTSLIGGGGSSYDTLTEDEGNTYLEASGSLSVAQDLTVDNGTLYVNSGTNRVGIGTTAPDVELDVAEGNIEVGNLVRHNGDSDTQVEFEADRLKLTAGGAIFLDAVESTSDTLVLNQGGDIDVNVKDSSGDALLYTDAGNSRVGIGIALPQRNFHIQSNTTVYSRLENTAATDATYLDTAIGGATGVSFITDTGQMRFRPGGNNVMVMESNGAVAIGDDESADAMLEIVDNGDPELIMVSSTASADGDLLTFTDEGWLGIGTTTPAAMLDVAQDVSVTLDLTVGNILYLDIDGDGSYENVGVTIDGLSNYWEIDGAGISTTTGLTNVSIEGNLSVDGTFHTSGGIVATNITVPGYVDAGGSLTSGDVIESTSASYTPYPKNVKIARTGNATVNVTYDAMMVQGMFSQNQDLTCTISSSGKNGLESGDSEAAKRWYQLSVIDGPDIAPALLLNEWLTTTGITSVTLPSGYTLQRQIGAVFNDGSSNLTTVSNDFLRVNDRGEFSAWDIEEGVMIEDGSLYTYDFTHVVPPNALGATVKMFLRDTSAAGKELYVVPKGYTTFNAANIVTQVANQKVVDNNFVQFSQGTGNVGYYDIQVSSPTGTINNKIAILNWTTRDN